MSMEENNRLGDLLKYESDKNYCREVVTIAEGQNLKMGTIIGVVTESEKAKIVALTKEKTVNGTTTIVQADEDDTALDGSEVPFGVLLEDVDATSEARKALVVVRDAIIASDYVVFPGSASEDQKKAIKLSLEKRGIVIRKSA